MDIKILLKKIKCNIISRDGNNCWIWQGAISYAGYGVYGKTPRFLAHRIIFALFNKIAIENMKGKVVMHSCDNPPCVNPMHLKLGTHLENRLDSVQKRRHNFGERNGTAKLTEEQVKIIKGLINKGQTVVQMGNTFGVAATTLYAIRQDRTWRHIKT